MSPGRASAPGAWLSTWRGRIRLVGHETVIDRLLTGGPVILLTGHFGNWEMAGYVTGLVGLRTYAIAREIDNPHLDRFLPRQVNGGKRRRTTEATECSQGKQYGAVHDLPHSLMCQYRP